MAERQLAAAILLQAWNDAAQELPPEPQPPKDGASKRDLKLYHAAQHQRRTVSVARAWLQGLCNPERLKFWCRVADISPHHVTKRAQQLWPE
jgi:hypothetical protein